MPSLTTQWTADEHVVIQTTNLKKNQPIPPFLPLGKGGKSKHEITGLDPLPILRSLTANSTRFFWFLAMHREFDTNLVKLRKCHPLSKREKGRIPRAYAELSKQHLIVREQRSVYLINPKVILPTFEHYSRTWEHWVQCRMKAGLSPEP